MDGFCGSEGELCFVDAGEGREAAAEEDGGDVDGELVDVAAVEGLTDEIGAA